MICPLYSNTDECILDYLPVYFQASLGASAVGSGVDMFALCLTIPPFAIFTGLSVQILNRYRPQNYVGWILIIVGFGILSLLDEKSSRAMYIGSQIPVAVGLGIVWISTQFPILAPLPFSNSAHALSFFTFIRCFAQVRSLHCDHFLLVLTQHPLSLCRAGVSFLGEQSCRTRCSTSFPARSRLSSRKAYRSHTPSSLQFLVSTNHSRARCARRSRRPHSSPGE